MVVREAYRDSTVSICHDHYHERKPLPEDAPALGPVQDARRSASLTGRHGAAGCRHTAAASRGTEEAPWQATPATPDGRGRQCTVT